MLSNVILLNNFSYQTSASTKGPSSLILLLLVSLNRNLPFNIFMIIENGTDRYLLYLSEIRLFHFHSSSMSWPTNLMVRQTTSDFQKVFLNHLFGPRIKCFQVYFCGDQWNNLGFLFECECQWFPLQTYLPMGRT